MVKLLAAMREYWEGAEDRAPVRVDPRVPLQTALFSLDQAIQDSGATIHVAELPAVTAEEESVSRLFQNLIGNAVKYRNPGQRPEITIRADLIGSFVRFAVTDNGPGIDRQYLSLVFQPFKRLHGREYEGIGMGLALCRKIVERFGGRIWAESDGAGKGSTFYFTLPAGDRGFPTPEKSRQVPATLALPPDSDGLQ
jgi:light-regulated signal transduction histidine kinase (bacteriophytochrome)